MRTIVSKLVLTSIILGFLPITSFADEGKLTEAFKTNCIKAWMDSAGNTADKVAYQNFGEKYCDCGSKNKLETKEDINKVAQICMSQSILHDTMDGLEDKTGLKNLTAEKIQSGCGDTWKIIYANMDDKTKTATGAYCQCVAPKLYEMTKNSENMTDKTWYEKMNGIAGECAGNVEPNKPTTDVPEPVVKE